MDRILYQIFKIIFITLKNTKQWLNLPIRIYVNQIENRIAFTIKKGYYLQLLTPETKKLFGSTKSKKKWNCENVPHLEITEVVLAYWNTANNDYQHYSGVLNIFIPNKSFGQLSDISRKNFIILTTCRVFICWSLVYWSNF